MFFRFGLARVKLSDPGTLADLFEHTAAEQSEACWWGMETGI